jgi:hypothetical protein
VVVETDLAELVYEDGGVPERRRREQPR